jgi:hypothetical protein
MPKRVQRFGHPGAIARDFVGLERELTIDTTVNTAHIHDGSTPGGHPLAKADGTNLPLATAGQNGLMSNVTFGELETAKADILTLQGEMVTAQADIVQLQTDVTNLGGDVGGKLNKIGSPVSGSLVSVAAAEDGHVLQYDFTVDDIAKIPEDTQMVFKQPAAPLGWVLNALGNDRVLRINTAGGGGTGGSWTISGVTAAGVALAANQLPSHFHYTTRNQAATVSAGLNVGVGDSIYSSSAGGLGNSDYTLQGSPSLADVGRTSSVGSGNTHTHIISSDGLWRPMYMDVILCKRAANPAAP